MVVLALSMSEFAGATIVDVSVATDKPQYQFEEDVIVSVSAYNPTESPVTLTFGSDIQTSYWMDSIYDWEEGRSRLTVITYVKIAAYDSYTWQMTHAAYERTQYPLDLGAHTVVGEVLGYGLSDPVEFEVIPEPSTIIMISIGVIWFKKKKIKSREFHYILGKEKCHENENFIDSGSFGIEYF